MKHTKEWWSALTPDERSWLVYAERHQGAMSFGCAYLPDDCTECCICGQPCFCSSPCRDCLSEMSRLIDKANEAMLRKGGQSGR